MSSAKCPSTPYRNVKITHSGSVGGQPRPCSTPRTHGGGRWFLPLRWVQFPPWPRDGSAGPQKGRTASVGLLQGVSASAGWDCGRGQQSGVRCPRPRPAYWDGLLGGDSSLCRRDGVHRLSALLVISRSNLGVSPGVASEGRRPFRLNSVLTTRKFSQRFSSPVRTCQWLGAVARCPLG